MDMFEEFQLFNDEFSNMHSFDTHTLLHAVILVFVFLTTHARISKLSSEIPYHTDTDLKIWFWITMMREK